MPPCPPGRRRCPLSFAASPYSSIATPGEQVGNDLLDPADPESQLRVRPRCPPDWRVYGEDGAVARAEVDARRGSSATAKLRRPY